MQSLLLALSEATTHTANAKYLASLSSADKAKVLGHMARHYNISTKEAEAELLNPEAENVYEYLASDRALAMSVLRAFKAMR